MFFDSLRKSPVSLNLPSSYFAHSSIQPSTMNTNATLDGYSLCSLVVVVVETDG